LLGYLLMKIGSTSAGEKKQCPASERMQYADSAESPGLCNFYSTTSSTGSIIFCCSTSMKPLSVIAYSGIAARQMNERNMQV
jgi:hypothetical protein